MVCICVAIIVRLLTLNFQVLRISGDLYYPLQKQFLKEKQQKKKDPKHLHNLAISHQYDRKVRRTQNPFRQAMI